MNIETVKEKLNPYVGKTVTIHYNLGRNKFEKYHVTIKKLYDYTFLVQDQIRVKSFSYSDVITKTIKIDYWQIYYNYIKIKLYI